MMRTDAEPTADQIRAAIDYLSEIDRQRILIGMLRAEYDAAITSINLLPGVTYDGVHVQTSSRDSKVIRMVEECAFKLTRLLGELERYEQDRAARIDLIRQLDDPKLSEVLMLRYVLGRYWWQVAREMRCTRQTIYRLHKEAIAKISQIL